MEVPMKRYRKRLSSIEAVPTVPVWITQHVRDSLSLLSKNSRNDYLRDVSFSKFVSSETDPAEVRRTRAISKWLATERENEATNDRLEITHADYNILPRVRYESFVSKCREVLASVIGDVPPDDCLIGSFSGGASTSRKRTESHPAFKYVGQAHVTASALPFFEVIREDLAGWSSNSPFDFKIVEGNVLFTVPKSTDIDRCACKEPDINMFLQKGVGSFIRKRLRRHGIDLNDQSVNRDLARQGSIDGSLATLDLSSASDSVSTRLVECLLPDLWFSLLNALRCEVTIIDGERHVNEMFSSMGNGFTFELESLLFYVLARTTAYFRGIPGIISVYGDDIIVPTDLAPDLMFVLNFFGFQVNPDKSFWNGTFRESCGGHYDGGRDVTPFYVKEPISTVLDLIHLLNRIRKWSALDGPSGAWVDILADDLYPLWNELRQYVPKHLWGGRDVDSKFQLVTHDEPDLRIMPIVSKQDTGLGGYIHWLNSTDRRAVMHDHIETSSYLKDVNKFRLTRASRMVSSMRWFFLEELTSEALGAKT